MRGEQVTQAYAGTGTAFDERGFLNTRDQGHTTDIYASLLIRHGESVKVVQAWLGHATAAETLDTYSHLWPDSDDTTRAAVERGARHRPGDKCWSLQDMSGGDEQVERYILGYLQR